MFEYFSFKKIISSLLIKLLHLIGLLSITIYGFYQIFNGELVQGLLTILVGNLIWRILCEGMIIIFSIHERLVSIEINSQSGYDPRRSQF